MVTLGRKKPTDDMQMQKPSTNKVKLAFFRKSMEPKTPPITTPDEKGSTRRKREEVAIRTVDVPSYPKSEKPSIETSSTVSDLSTPYQEVLPIAQDPPANMMRSGSLVADEMEEPEPIVPQSSLVTTVLGMVDMSCVSTRLIPEANVPPPKDLRNSLTYLPEWGVAPDGKRKSISPMRRETFELVYRDPLEKSKKPQRLWSKKQESRPSESATLGIARRDNASDPLVSPPSFTRVEPVIEPFDHRKPANRNPAARLRQALAGAKKEKEIKKKEAQKQKKVLQSIKGSSLETVHEESEGGEGGAELKVRVPGNPDSFLVDKDLIGDEIVEEIYATLEMFLAQEEAEPQLQTVQTIVSETSQVVMETHPRTPTKKDGYQEFLSDGEDEEDEIPRSRSWKDRWLGASKSDSHEEQEKSVKKDKPQWKAAMDPSTGRTYYYHRKTRETTWNKPPDKDIAPPKAEKKRNGNPLDVSEAEINRRLSQLAPGAEKLVSEYEGRESELLGKLRDIAETQPFDEPIEDKKTTENSRTDEKSKADEKSVANRTNAQTIYSGFSSHKSRISEKTEPINNTSKTTAEPPLTPSRIRKAPKIPQNIPVPRLRELNVEEFSTRRDRLDRVGRKRSPAEPVIRDDHNYMGDNEGGDEEEKDERSYATDSVSALSEAEISCVDHDDARRRALHRAIAQEDWELGAQLLNVMRKTNKPVRVPSQAPETDVERLISQNNWDAVDSYIVQARTRAQQDSLKMMSQHLKKPKSQHLKKPKSRFGARSQLQHKDTGSSDSYETNSSDYSSESEDSGTEEEGLPPPQAKARRPKEFFC